MADTRAGTQFTVTTNTVHGLRPKSDLITKHSNAILAAHSTFSVGEAEAEVECSEPKDGPSPPTCICTAHFAYIPDYFLYMQVPYCLVLYVQSVLII